MEAGATRQLASHSPSNAKLANAKQMINGHGMIASSHVYKLEGGTMLAHRAG